MPSRVEPEEDHDLIEEIVLPNKFSVILLAAQRTGVVNPLAEKYGTSHKCLIPINGTPLIERMLDILMAHPRCGSIRVMIEPDGEANITPILDRYRAKGAEISVQTSDANIAESVVMGCKASKPPFVITTADNVLLSHAAIDSALQILADGADGLFTLAREADVKTVHEQAQSRFYDFRDGGYANCNLYVLANEKALGAAEIFREGGQFQNNPKRLVTAFGLFNILLMRFKLITLQQALRRASTRFGLDLRAQVAAEGTQAVDVDNERTYMVTEMVLKAREGDRSGAA